MSGKKTPQNIGLTALIAGVVFFSSVMLTYVINFSDAQISDDPSHWGALGDFVGGIVNPLLGLVTIWLLTISLRQNNQMLDQAREELKATSEELKRGQEIQAATESALREQNLLAQNTRDLDGAISLIAYWQKKHDVLAQAERDEIQQAALQGKTAKDISEIHIKYTPGIIEPLKRIADFEHIIKFEADRLLEKYPPEIQS